MSDAALHRDQEEQKQREQEIEERADKLLQDEVWLWDTFACMTADKIKIVGSVGRNPFSMDRAQAFAQMLHEAALEDARYMHESYIPVFCRKQCGG